MGLETSNGAFTTFLTISEGALTQQVKEPTEATVSRTNKKGNVVHELHFRSLTANITGISLKENDFGKFITIHMRDEAGNYQIQMPYSSRYSASFLKTLPNVNPGLPIKVLPWSMVDKNNASKKITGITVYQNDQKIAPSFTKENPNGLPQMTVVKFQGKDQYDDFEYMNFLWKVGQDFVAKIPSFSSSVGSGAVYNNIAEISGSQQTADDLPF